MSEAAFAQGEFGHLKAEAKCSSPPSKKRIAERSDI